MRTSSSNALATRSIDEVWAGVRRSSRIQILLELPVEVLVRPDVEDFDDVSLRVELVGKQKLKRLDFELDVPHTLERSDLGLADDRSAMPSSISSCAVAGSRRFAFPKRG